MFLILISSILLALDNPLNDPNSTLTQCLFYMDIAITTIFLIESLIKIIVHGLIVNGTTSYLRSGWNIMDFSIVLFSMISLCIENSDFKILRIFRLMRVLRPLRLISRNKLLKIAIHSLFMAIPSILNVIVVSFIFFIIFGIIGVNYFKGTFFNCTGIADFT